MNKETILMRQIMVALSEMGCFVMRTNSGVYYDSKGNRIRVGFKGLSDLVGYNQDGQFFALEIKTPAGKASKEQLAFIEKCYRDGAIAGFARSVEDAVRIATGIKLSSKEPVFNQPADMEEINMCLNCDSPTCNGDCEKVRKKGRWSY